MVRSLASSTIPVSTGMCILHEEQRLFDAIKLREACSTYSVFIHVLLLDSTSYTAQNGCLLSTGALSYI